MLLAPASCPSIAADPMAGTNPRPSVWGPVHVAVFATHRRRCKAESRSVASAETEGQEDPPAQQPNPTGSSGQDETPYVCLNSCVHRCCVLASAFPKCPRGGGLGVREWPRSCDVKVARATCSPGPGAPR